MTQLLYTWDSMIKGFDAVVARRDDQLHAVTLDQTAFYPGGGGQPCDQGWLQYGGQPLPVQQVKKVSGEVWHCLPPEVTLPGKGEVVRGVLDWERRYQLMRTHTAMHVLCGVVWRDYGASVTGGDMDPLEGRMDFEFERFSAELVHTIEAAVNQEIEAGHEVTVKILPREEAFAIPDLIRTKINLLPEGIKEVRTVEIKGLDLQADGGTHVLNTREVGRVRVVKHKSKGRINKRIYVAVEE
jgi:misacylated tRNA(Ala) deacylase